MLLLAGDIGGTNARLGIFYYAGSTAEDGCGDKGAPRLEMLHHAVLPIAEHESMRAVLTHFLETVPQKIGRGAGKETLSAACVGVPGPVENDTAVAPNLPWDLSVSSIAAILPKTCRSVSLCNDLVTHAAALAYGDPAALGAVALLAQSEESQESDVKVLLAPGTGLGQAFVVKSPGGGGWRVCPSEGGHVDFAPVSDDQVALWQMLRRRYGHVSYERVLSGPGISAMHDFFRRQGEEGDAVRGGASAAMATAHTSTSARQVIEQARRGDEAAARALRLFVEILGAAAGNLALTYGARSIYLSGGIVPRIVPEIVEATAAFAEAFRSKGRLRRHLGGVEVVAMTAPELSLHGAAALAHKALCASLL